MYKVFIDNRPAIFEIDKREGHYMKSEEAADTLRDFMASDLKNLYLVLKSDKAFWKVFKSFKLIEAAGGMVNRDGKYLFIYRNGKWDIPKGKIDKGEGIEEAAVREIEEECGLEKPEIVDELCITYHTYELNGKNILKKTYWFLLNDKYPKDIVPQLEEGITDLEFLAPNEFGKIRENTFPSIIDVMEVLEKRF